MLQAYVVHCMEGKGVCGIGFGRVAVRAAAQNALGKEGGVEEVRPGAESLLLLLQPGVDVAGLCARLETSVPVLARPRTGCGRAPRLPVPAGAKIGGNQRCARAVAAPASLLAAGR